jgi:hypothetical protein
MQLLRRARARAFSTQRPSDLSDCEADRRILLRGSCHLDLDNP